MLEVEGRDYHALSFMPSNDVVQNYEFVECWCGKP
jgi:hypothetical protein